MSEEVLVIPRELAGSLTGNSTDCLIPCKEDEIFSLIRRKQLFMQRDDAESDPGYKQVIPYVTVRYRDDILLLRRLNMQTEKRLHNKLSLGIGGHINPLPEGSDEDLIMKGLFRELNEEVALSSIGSLKFCGLINDDSNSVSRVHIGLLFEMESLSREFRVLETEKMTGQWVPLNALPEYYDGLETWSQIVFNDYLRSDT